MRKLSVPNRFWKYIQNLYFLFFLNGLLAASLFFFATESGYETELFSAISREIKTELSPGYTKEDYTIKALQTSNYLQERRYYIFGKQEIGGIKANIFHPSTIDLMTNKGACGSYVTVLSRILKSNDIKVRIGQMKVNGTYGGHMIVEANLNNRWVVLDPTYSICFRNPDSSLASFSDLKNNWNYYKNQAPPDYDENYKFEDVRYTNWEKVPLFLPVTKNILDWVLGKEAADGISIRPYLLRNYHKLAWITCIVLIVVFLFTLKVYRKQKQL
jgi:hypothetical protein